jgi:uncharacterized protein
MAISAKRVGRALLIGYLVGCIVAGIALAHVSLHLSRNVVSAWDGAQFQELVQKDFQTHFDDVSMTAADGAVLKAWFVQPAKSNGKAVLILHGIGGNREGSSGFAEMFLAQGYAVLLPDSRAHGASGGREVTFGILERDDVRRWVDWVRQRDAGCTYLLGESMGAAIGLEATAVTPQLCAVAVESPYARFREISYERLGRGTHLGPVFWSTVGRPILEVAIAYTKIRYGIYLPNAEPLAAVEQSNVPSLLIAGTLDENIPMHHAEELEKVCASHCSLWIVPGADHGGASEVEHDEFDRRVLDWFASHDRP